MPGEMQNSYFGGEIGWSDEIHEHLSDLLPGTIKAMILREQTKTNGGLVCVSSFSLMLQQLCSEFRQ